jgi:CelD/BcsL family acetyltransferase involved in cellulose biosynthesis
LITTEVLTEIDQLEKIAEEWSDLYNRASDATPFQAPFWIINWWKNFGKSRLITLIIRNDGELICVAPWFLYFTDADKKCLCLLGTGVSDYLDVLYISKYTEEIKREVRNFLYTISDQWEVCDFQELPITSPLLQLYENSGPYIIKLLIQSTCSDINGSNAKSVRQIIPKKLRKNIQNCINSINSKYTISLEPNKSPENLIHLHSKRWNQKNQTGVLNGNEIQKFHYDVFSCANTNNNVMIYSLKIQDQIIACYYLLIRKNSAYFYLSGFDPSYHQYSPGTLALYLTIEELFKEGITTFDFLRGIEEYKNHWGVKYKHNYGLKIYNFKLTNRS